MHRVRPGGAPLEAGLVRGWEKFFRTADGAVAICRVFLFEDADGPAAMVERFEDLPQPGYDRFDIPGVPSGTAASGLSPEGRSALAAAAGRDRFLFSVVLGGPPDAHVDRLLLEDLMQAQFEALAVT